VSRAIEFNTEEVINLTMQTFWDNGLKTTLSDIEASTGLSRSSIYNTFGNKDELFRLSMMSYLEFLEEWIHKAYDHLSFKQFLKAILDDAATENFEGRGCFFYNCVGSADILNLEIKKILDMAYISMRTIFEKRISLAQHNNEFDLNMNVSGYATLLMATIAGLRAFNLSGFPKEELQNAAAVALLQLI
jgi:TetR/AcrR family transcriptional repressor of nem operon